MDRASAATSIAAPPPGQQTGPAAQAKSGSSGVVGWFGQSLAAIKRRGRSTDDPDQANAQRLANSSAAYGDSSQQRSIPESSSVSEPLPAASSSEPAPVNNTAGASQSSAQHAQQAGPVPQVKRKPGRPRKVLPAVTAGAHATASSNQLPAIAALLSYDSGKAPTPSNLSNSNLSSNAAARSQRRVPPASSAFDATPQSPEDQAPGADTDAADLPAGALIPQAAQKSASVAIDINKLLKSRGSQQVRDTKRLGQGSTTAATHPTPATGPAAAASAGGGGGAGSGGGGGGGAAAGPSNASGEANTEAPAASQAAQASTDPAAAATAHFTGAIAPAGQKGAKRGRPSKHAKLDAQNRALQPTVPAADTATAAGTSNTQPAAAANAGSDSSGKAEAVAPLPAAMATAQDPSAGVEILASNAIRLQSGSATTAEAAVHAGAGATAAASGGDAAAAGASAGGVASEGHETSDAVRLQSGSATTAGPAAAVSGGGVSGMSADLGQEGSQNEVALGEQGRGQPHGKDLPLGILLEGTSGKKRGRPYKNAANAEKAAERAARKAAAEAAEKAAYEAAAGEGQAEITAPPVKKRRGRPPKDPAKLAAALAAYHAHTTARQASLDAKEADSQLGSTDVKAARAAVAAAEAALVHDSSPAEALAPPVKKKRGRPPRAVAKAAAESAQALVSSPDGMHEEDHDQAVLDAAAVLTSSLPFLQGIAHQPVHQKGRKPKGRRAAPPTAAVRKTHAQQLGQFEHENARKSLAGEADPLQPEVSRTQPGHRLKKRQLEMVSSRANAILDSIAPEGQPEDKGPFNPPSGSGGPPAPLMDAVDGRSPQQSLSNQDSETTQGHDHAGSPSMQQEAPEPGFGHTMAGSSEGISRDESAPAASPRSGVHSNTHSGSKQSALHTQTNRPSVALRQSLNASSPRKERETLNAATSATAVAEITSVAGAQQDALPEAAEPAAMEEDEWQDMPQGDVADVAAATKTAAEPTVQGAIMAQQPPIQPLQKSSTAIRPQEALLWNRIHSPTASQQPKAAVAAKKQSNGRPHVGSGMLSVVLPRLAAPQAVPEKKQSNGRGMMGSDIPGVTLAHESAVEMKPSDGGDNDRLKMMPAQGAALEKQSNGMSPEKRESNGMSPEKKESDGVNPMKKQSNGVSPDRPSVVLPQGALQAMIEKKQSISMSTDKPALKSAEDSAAVKKQSNGLSPDRPAGLLTQDPAAEKKQNGSSRNRAEEAERPISMPAHLASIQGSPAAGLRRGLHRTAHPAKDSLPLHTSLLLPQASGPSAARMASADQLHHQAPCPSAAQQPADAQHAHYGQQAQQAQHAQQEAQPAIQPVLALLTSGLPPIVLGTFQGDMQRARIILEAAGFLTPFDLSSSLLPGALHSSPAARAGHAGHAGASTSPEDDGRSEDEEAAVQHALDLSKSTFQQTFEQGAGLHGADIRKQGGRVGQPPRMDRPLSATPGKAGIKRGRPTNLARQAAAVAAAAEQMRAARGTVAERDSLSQEDWEHMGFHGELQGTGQFASGPQQDAHDPLTRESRRQRKPSAKLQQQDQEAQEAKSLKSPKGKVDLLTRQAPPTHYPGGSHAMHHHTDTQDFDDNLHIPRRKRSKPTELIRPLELLAQGNAVAARLASRAASGAAAGQAHDVTDNLSCLAAAAAAESESDAELAELPSHARQVAGSSRQSGAGGDRQQHSCTSPTQVSRAGAGGEALVGRRVAKRFGSHATLFRGKIGYYAPRLCPLAPFHIQYEDGDTEDLNREQVEAILV